MVQHGTSKRLASKKFQCLTGMGFHGRLTVGFDLVRLQCREIPADSLLLVSSPYAREIITAVKSGV